MRIVIAVDGSEDSMDAVRYLSKIPFRTLPDVLLVTALTEFPIGIVAVETGITVREEEKELANQNYLKAKSILVGRCASINSVIDQAHPSRLILDIAQEHNADLIVVGARGHSAVYRMLLGSTADFIANHAKCSVLVVRSKRAFQGPEGDEQYRIMLAYDGSPHAKTAIEQLQQVDWPASASEIHLAMLLERPKLVPEDVVYDPVALGDSKQVVGKLASSMQLSCPVTHTVRETLHIGNAMTSLAEDRKSNLIFLGGSGKSALTRFFLGSTSRYVLHHCHCSVWIARPTQWS